MAPPRARALTLTLPGATRSGGQPGSPIAGSLFSRAVSFAGQLPGDRT